MRYASDVGLIFWSRTPALTGKESVVAVPAAAAGAVPDTDTDTAAGTNTAAADAVAVAAAAVAAVLKAAVAQSSRVPCFQMQGPSVWLVQAARTGSS